MAFFSHRVLDLSTVLTMLSEQLASATVDSPCVLVFRRVKGETPLFMK